VVDTQQGMPSGGRSVNLIGTRLDRFHAKPTVRTWLATNPRHTSLDLWIRTSRSLHKGFVMTTWKIISVVLAALFGIISVLMVIRTLRADRQPSFIKVIGWGMAVNVLNGCIGMACMHFNLP